MQNRKNCSLRPAEPSLRRNGKRPHAGDHIGGTFKRRAAGENLCAVDTVQPYSLDSTNMCWKQWIHVAEIIRDSYAKYDGFVIAHGTDTLSYAAATLSYLIQKNEKPVVLTGAQKSIEVPDGDARRNLFEAFVYATDARACGTHVVFNGHVIAGTRARKTHTKSFDAFSSIDFPDIGVFYDKKLLCYIDERSECSGAVFYDKLVPEILSIRVIPGMDPSVFDYITAHCRGVVIESFGVGGIPYYGDNAFEEKIAALMENGVRVVITTQVPHGAATFPSTAWAISSRKNTACSKPPT